MQLQNYEIDLNKIKPKNIKKSDKYSKVIFKYLKNNPQYRRVWFDESAYSMEHGKYVKQKFDVNNMNFKNMFFGILDGENSDCLEGKCIQSLIAGGKGSQENCFYIGHDKSHYVEVTKEFYEKYIEIGRCIYGHKVYLCDDDSRYTYLDNTHRKCNWCGKDQYEETVTYTYERKVWKTK